MRVRQAELARMLGVSRQAISDLVRRDILRVHEDGLIDPLEARAALENSVRPSAKTAQTVLTTEAPASEVTETLASNATEADPPSQTQDPATSSAVTSYHVAKTLRETAEARIAQIRLQELRREVISVQAVRQQLAMDYTTTRESLLQLPSRLGSTLAAESDPAAVERLLRAEIHQALTRLAGAADAVVRADTSAAR
jgi:hypothetical protein